MQINPQILRQLNSVLTKLYELSPLLLSSFLIILAIVSLWSYQTNRINKKPQQTKLSFKSSHHHEPQLQVPNLFNRVSSKRSYKFSADEDYIIQRNQINNQYSEQQELISMLRDNQPKQYYSLKKAKQDFLKNFKSKPDQSFIYMDQNDIKYKQARKSEIQKMNQAVQTPQNKAPKQQTTKKPPKKQKQQIKQKQSNIKPPTIIKQNIIPNKNIAKQNPQVKPQIKLPQKIIDFKNISFGLQPQKKESLDNKNTLFSTPLNLNDKKQNTSLFGNQPNNGSSLFNFNLGQQKTQDKNDQKVEVQTLGQIKKQQQPAENKNTIQTPPSLFTPTNPPPGMQNKQGILNIQKPAPPQPSPSQPSQIPVQPSAPRLQGLSKATYLQKVIDYSTKAKQNGQLKKTKINNFGRSISNFKQIYQTAIDFINTINLSDPKQMQTLSCVIFDFLLNKTIPVWPKQQGWQMFPPRGKNQTKWKISITTYVLKLNIYRIMGYQSLWLTVFGKLLSLLDFTWKRTQSIKKSQHAYKQLDLVKNGYFSLQKQDDMAPKYFTRLDLVTYFLFCMTTFDPQLVGQYLCQTAGQDVGTLQQIKKYKYKWSYNYFWILTQAVLKNPNKSYFKPILHMNILSSMYLQIRRNKLNSTQFQDFDYLRGAILKQAIEMTTPRALQNNQQVQALADIQQETREFRFDGQDFLGQIETLNFYFKQKDSEYRKATDKKGFEDFEKRCSVFDYFKSQSKIG